MLSRPGCPRAGNRRAGSPRQGTVRRVFCCCPRTRTEAVLVLTGPTAVSLFAFVWVTWVAAKEAPAPVAASRTAVAAAMPRRRDAGLGPRCRGARRWADRKCGVDTILSPRKTLMASTKNRGGWKNVRVPGWKNLGIRGFIRRCGGTHAALAATVLMPSKRQAVDRRGKMRTDPAPRVAVPGPAVVSPAEVISTARFRTESVWPAALGETRSRPGRGCRATHPVWGPQRGWSRPAGRPRRCPGSWRSG